MPKKTCLDCGKELSFLKYTPKKEWNLSGDLCRDCYIKRVETEEKSKSPIGGRAVLYFLCILGFAILILGLFLTSLPMPQSVIDEAKANLRYALLEFGSGSAEAREAQRVYNMISQAHPYTALGLLVFLIGIVTIVMGAAIAAMGHTTKQTPETPIRVCPNCGKDLKDMPQDIVNCPYCSKGIQNAKVAIQEWRYERLTGFNAIFSPKWRYFGGISGSVALSHKANSGFSIRRKYELQAQYITLNDNS